MKDRSHENKRRVDRRLLSGVVFALVVLMPLAALAANTTRETGAMECSFDEDVFTRVRAKGDHRHQRIGIQTLDVDLPDDGLWRIGTGDWNVFAMEWGTGNQINRQYDWSGSFAYCV